MSRACEAGKIGLTSTAAAALYHGTKRTLDNVLVVHIDNLLVALFGIGVVDGHAHLAATHQLSLRAGILILEAEETEDRKGEWAGP